MSHAGEWKAVSCLVVSAIVNGSRLLLVIIELRDQCLRKKVGGKRHGIGTAEMMAIG